MISWRNSFIIDVMRMRRQRDRNLNAEQIVLQLPVRFAVA